MPLFFHLTHFRELRQKYKNIFVWFFVPMKTSKFAFKINWPLENIIIVWFWHYFLIFLGSSDVVIVTTDKTSKFDQLHSVRYKLEHNQLSRLKPESDKINVFQTLDKHIRCSKDWEVKQFAVQLIHVSAHHMSSRILKKQILNFLFVIVSLSEWRD